MKMVLVVVERKDATAFQSAEDGKAREADGNDIHNDYFNGQPQVQFNESNSISGPAQKALRLPRMHPWHYVIKCECADIMLGRAH